MSMALRVLLLLLLQLHVSGTSPDMLALANSFMCNCSNVSTIGTFAYTAPEVLLGKHCSYPPQQILHLAIPALSIRHSNVIQCITKKLHCLLKCLQVFVLPVPLSLKCGRVVFAGRECCEKADIYRYAFCFPDTLFP